MLSRVVPLRRKLWEEHRAAVAAGRVAHDAPPPAYPLKLIIMSATLRTQVSHRRRRMRPACGAKLMQPVRLSRCGHACMHACPALCAACTAQEPNPHLPPSLPRCTCARLICAHMLCVDLPA